MLGVPQGAANQMRGDDVTRGVDVTRYASRDRSASRDRPTHSILRRPSVGAGGLERDQGSGGGGVVGVGGGRERVLEAKRRLGVGELAKLAPGESIRTVFRLCFRPQGRRMFLKLLVL